MRRFVAFLLVFFGTQARAVRIGLRDVLPSLSRDCSGGEPGEVARCERVNKCVNGAQTKRDKSMCAVDCTDVTGDDLLRCTGTRDCLRGVDDEPGRIQCVCAFLPEGDKHECSRTSACVRNANTVVEKHLCGIDCGVDRENNTPQKTYECHKIRSCLTLALGDRTTEHTCFSLDISPPG